MPELPEVEVERRYLARHARGQPVTGVRAPHPDVLSATTAPALGRRLKGHAIQSTRRHGKYLFARFDSGDWLAMHFGMTGTLRYCREDSGTPDYTAVLFRLKGGHDLAYVSRRRLGRIVLIEDPGELVAARGLGPDALRVDADSFRQRITAGRGGMKSWLMNQKNIAGIGNEYSDEILFQAGVHPGRTTASLTGRETDRLYRTMGAVLKKAIALRADPKRMPASWLAPRRAANALCPGCGGRVRTTTAGGRTGYYCPVCQPRVRSS